MTPPTHTPFSWQPPRELLFKHTTRWPWLSCPEPTLLALSILADHSGSKDTRGFTWNTPQEALAFTCCDCHLENHHCMADASAALCTRHCNWECSLEKSEVLGIEQRGQGPPVRTQRRKDLGCDCSCHEHWHHHLTAAHSNCCYHDNHYTHIPLFYNSIISSFPASVLLAWNYTVLQSTTRYFTILQSTTPEHSTYPPGDIHTEAHQ